MNIEAHKLQLIERFMKFHEASDLRKLEDLISEIESEMRIKASESDIAEGRVRSYDSFSKDVKAWMAHRRNSK